VFWQRIRIRCSLQLKSTGETKWKQNIFDLLPFTHTHTHSRPLLTLRRCGAHPTAIDSEKCYVTFLYYNIIVVFFLLTYSQPGYTAFASPCIVVYIRHVANTVIVCLCIEFVFAFTSAPRAEVCTRCMSFGRRTTGVDPFLNSYPPHRVSSPLTRGVEYRCVYIYSTHTSCIVCRYSCVVAYAQYSSKNLDVKNERDYR